MIETYLHNLYIWQIYATLKGHTKLANVLSMDMSLQVLYLSENVVTGKVPSAPPLALGTAVFHARVKWPEGHIPRKGLALRKALQTWLRKDLGSVVEIESLKLEDATEWAKVEIYPSTGKV